MAKLKPVHPGEILREEFMEPLKLNPHRLALALRVPAPGIYEIVKEERAISTEMALRLARFFRTTPEFAFRVPLQKTLARCRRYKSVSNVVEARVCGESIIRACRNSGQCLV